MFSIEASDVERLIKISWSGQVDSDEMRRWAEEIRATVSKMRPGFRILADMTNLEAMDSGGAPYIGSIMVADPYQPDFVKSRRIEAFRDLKVQRVSHSKTLQVSVAFAAVEQAFEEF